MKEKVWNLLYPKTCPICQNIIRGDEEICEKCYGNLEFIREPKCKKCGKRFESVDISNEIREYCGDCAKNEHLYEFGMAVFRYDDNIKESIYRFKYHNQRTYAGFYGKTMAAAYGKLIGELGVEVIIPVPIHYKKRIKRGYNQAELIADELGTTLGIPVDNRILVRDKATTPQKELSNVERRNNLKKAFKIAESIVKYKKVLIVDDIYTTGSTVDACASALKKAGAGQIYFISLSIGAGI